MVKTASKRNSSRGGPLNLGHRVLHYSTTQHNQLILIPTWLAGLLVERQHVDHRENLDLLSSSPTTTEQSPIHSIFQSVSHVLMRVARSCSLHKYYMCIIKTSQPPCRYSQRTKCIAENVVDVTCACLDAKHTYCYRLHS